MRSQFLLGSLWMLALPKPQIFPTATITRRTLNWIRKMMGALRLA